MANILIFLLIVLLALCQAGAIRSNNTGAWGLGAFWWQLFGAMFTLALTVTLTLVLL